MEHLKTAEEMLDFCMSGATNAGTTINWNYKHFRVIESELKKDEYAFTAFTGLIGGFNYAFVITKDRIIAGQKKVVGQKVKSIYLNQINDISSRIGPLHGFIEVDTIKEKFEFCVVAKNAKNITRGIQEALEYSKNPMPSKGTAHIDPADQLLKYKQLLDMGGITKEEYEAKKEQLLKK